MSAPVNKPEAQRIYAHIGANPGVRQRGLARALGARYGTIGKRLIGMELVGLLLSEDADGGLYCFGVDSWRWGKPISWNGRVKDG